MLKILHEEWNQFPESLYQSGLSEPHHRTRERFMAPYRIACNESPTQVIWQVLTSLQQRMIFRQFTGNPQCQFVFHKGFGFGAFW